jgi:hypothetical protein
MKSISINKVSAKNARRFFRSPAHYVNYELPYYVNFDEVLTICGGLLLVKSLSSHMRKQPNRKPVRISDYDAVNHTVLSNKDGSFAWRPLKIIHPLLYIDLSNLITEPDNWGYIQDLFERSSASSVKCISLPRVSKTEQTDKAEQVRDWWERIEQESLRLALDFSYIFKTDISDCYPSVYTHSLEWSFHSGGRIGVKQDIANGVRQAGLGTKIDEKLRQMNRGQTIGIPQGSTLMDLIAEIVLAGVDIEFTKEVSNQLSGFKDYKILRYRDDYRIFTNDLKNGQEMMKILSSVLYQWNFKMNASKTSDSADVISSSIKSEKLNQIVGAPIRMYYQKEAIRIYKLSQDHPNSGLVAVELSKYYDRINKDKFLMHFNFDVIASIISMIGYFSPRYIPQVSAIISIIMERAGDKDFSVELASRIHSKFQSIPNSDLIDIWLQRITAPAKMKMHYTSALTDVIIGNKNNSVLWNSDFLDDSTAKIINEVKISSLESLIDDNEISFVIEPEEFQLFGPDYD